MPPVETEYPALVMPETVERTTVTIWSNGVPLDADLYRPKGIAGDRRIPAVVLSHGWGGSKSTGERHAAKFAAAGMMSLCFSYSGWSFSGSQVVLAGEAPALDEGNEGFARVRVIREVIDPVEWLQNYRSAVDFIEGEPHVDTDRIGAWGTSFGGGIALHHAANDPRIKVLAVQVASLASVLKGPLAAHARQRAIDMARGTIASVPQGIDAYPPLAGTPHLARFLQYNAIEEVRKLRVPTLILDAGNEDLFDIRHNGGKAHEILKQTATAPVDYRIIDGIDHYGIYFDGYDESSDAALAWFDRYL
ncbi:alpha/beta hydrolase [Variovorax sp. GT1P44]|uniref:alpha/beta hydrolase n=1 Tax=Variovorax sp. GT1P44 TaxID=3443742 RepID=UPI003F46A34F